MKITGKIIEKTFGEGSKSEHEALYLETSEGTYLLQLESENPFEQPTLHNLVGTRVTAEGSQNKYLFVARTIEQITDKE